MNVEGLQKSWLPAEEYLAAGIGEERPGHPGDQPQPLKGFMIFSMTW